VDQGYTGEPPAQDAQAHGIRLEVVKLPEAKKGVVFFPRRWVVERSFAWATRFRRLVRDYERLPEDGSGVALRSFRHSAPETLRAASGPECITHASKFIPNPCEHVMFQHLRYRGVHVEATSAAGEITIKILDLNENERVNFREQVKGIIRYLEQTARQLQETLRRIDQGRTKDPKILAEVNREREETLNELARVRQYLTNLSGDS
jgi:hypothetical protein